MIAAANREGCGGANVSAIIEQAGVSRPTFYEYFEDRDGCLLAALQAVQGDLAAEIRRAIAEAPGVHPAHAAVEALVNFASSQPARARFLMGEMLAAGPDALDARDAEIDEIAKTIAAAESSAGDGAPGPDVPLHAAVGAVQRLLASRLRRGPVDPAPILAEILPWLESYERAATEQRWRLPHRQSLHARQSTSGIRLRPPPPLEPGRPRSSPGEVAENHRQRLLFAAASLAAEQGYTATTVAEVTDRARLDRRAFYSIFQDKRDLFMAVHEFVFQRLLAVSAGAFFSGADWPARMWAGVNGLCEFLDANPAIAHVGFVEAHAVGPGAVQRIEDSVSAFSVFLQEGYRHEQKVNSPSELALAAIVSAQFEILHRAARQRTPLRTAGLAGTLSFIALAPFLGPDASDRVIDAALQASGAEGRKAD